MKMEFLFTEFLVKMKEDTGSFKGNIPAPMMGNVREQAQTIVLDTSLVYLSKICYLTTYGKVCLFK